MPKRIACSSLTALSLAVLWPVHAELVRSIPDTEGTPTTQHSAPGGKQKIDILPGYDRSLGEISNGSGEALMLGGAMPKVIDIQDLPEPNSSKAQLLNRVCTQCHGLPSPDQHSADGWLPVVNRMKARMHWMTMYSNIRIDEPNSHELRDITDYLQQYARQSGSAPP